MWLLYVDYSGGDGGVCQVGNDDFTTLTALSFFLVLYYNSRRMRF